MKPAGERRGGSTRQRIVDSLCAAIYSGKLRPGEPLLELQLAREFHVSQTPVREALFQLERMGLVRRYANRGTVVTQLSAAEIRERVDLRRTLEVLAATQAALRINSAALAELREAVRRIAGAVSENDYFGSAVADLDFHRAIWKLADNQTLYDILDRLCAPLFAFMSIVRSSRRENIRRMARSHEEIVDALAAGDPASIRAVITAHFNRSYESIFDAGLDPVPSGPPPESGHRAAAVRR
jgi:DNA-binding GntR family transcriptional regulator